jgi:Fe-S oxidoreductase
MVTREEKHSTRGRARLLFEMLQGDPVNAGWRDQHVREALDLCLACKGCKGDCPVSVDMATYKGEFLSHYYARRLRPVTAYTMGLIYWWSRLAAHAPEMANLLTQTPLLRSVSRAAAGIAPERRIPAFASQPFKQWFRWRGSRNAGKPAVILWPDTFNNYFHPGIAQAAVEVLEAIGFRVEVPEQPLCCGRPLYDYGMLRLARRLLRQILDTLRPQIADGIPIIGLEPSCVAVFRDELVNLFPNDEDAKRLSRQTFLLSEFLEKKVGDFQPPQLQGKALVHGHCHHKAIMGMTNEERLLSKLGLDFAILDSGCCGMAGSFGLEKDHYDVSMKVGERVLLPAVRSAAKETLIIADGFSCREQIAQSTDRCALHLAQVIQMAMHEDWGRPAGPYPESKYADLTAKSHEEAGSRLRAAVIVGAGATLTGGALTWRLKRWRSG